MIGYSVMHQVVIISTRKKEIKDKEGKVIEVIYSPPVPYHGAKEMPEPLRRAIARDMNLR